MYKHSKGKNILQSPCSCFSEMRKSSPSRSCSESRHTQDILPDPLKNCIFVPVPLASFSFNHLLLPQTYTMTCYWKFLYFKNKIFRRCRVKGILSCVSNNHSSHSMIMVLDSVGFICLFPKIQFFHTKLSRTRPCIADADSSEQHCALLQFLPPT